MLTTLRCPLLIKILEMNGLTVQAHGRAAAKTLGSLVFPQ
jgi:hypothetical protein